MIHKVIGTLIATGGRGKLTGKDGSPTWSTKDSRGVGICKIDPAIGKLVDVRGDSPGSFA